MHKIKKIFFIIIKNGKECTDPTKLPYEIMGERLANSVK